MKASQNTSKARAKRVNTEEFKVEAVRLSEAVGCSEAAKRLGMPSGTLQEWRRARRQVSKSECLSPVQPLKRSYSKLEAELKELKRAHASLKLDNEIIKKSGGVFREGVVVRYAWVKAHRACYPVARMCRLLGVSRSGFNQWSVRPMSRTALENRALDAKIAALHAASGRSYGRLRIPRSSRAEGLRIGHERVRRSLQRQHLRPVYKRPYRVTTDSNHARPIVPNLLDPRFQGWEPNCAWVADITSIPTAQGWLYLACVLDWGGRRIVGWSMSERMQATLVCDALRMACVVNRLQDFYCTQTVVASMPVPNIRH